MREESLIRRVKKLIEEYSFIQPFSIFLRDHFRQHPEMGARDRRETRDLSFNILRIGKNLEDIPFEKRLSVACFLCNNVITPLYSYLFKTYSEFSEDDIVKSVEEKIVIVRKQFPAFNLEDVFPMHDELSNQIKKKEWFLSFLKKPKVWIRLRKIFLNDVLSEFHEKKISFDRDEDQLTLSFLPEVALEKTFSYQKGFFEVQDKSSQLTRDFFKPNANEYWWDACAGSGGKSLLLKEENDVKIFASDIRENILKTYVERMKKSGYVNPVTMVIDLSLPKNNFSENKFDGIIADVPCSGSGTWSRAPEWIHQKNMKQRLDEHFIPLQRQIVMSILPALKSGFPLIYITCSVFKKENEENIKFFIDHLPLKLEKSTYLEGFESGGDTLFIARFLKI